jgi:hypothetical protein
MELGFSKIGFDNFDEVTEHNWKVVEDNTKESFRLCKNDLINLGIQLAKVQLAQRQLSEQVGKLNGNTQPIIVRGDNGTTVDLSSIHARADRLERSFDELRNGNLAPVKIQTDERVEKQLADLRQRYNALVALTHELVKTVEQKFEQRPKLIKIVRMKAKAQPVKVKTVFKTRIVKVASKPRIIRVQSKPRIIKIMPKRIYIASTATMRVHDKHCPFSRNVKRKNKKVFKTRLTAFKRGYKACKCLR